MNERIQFLEETTKEDAPAIEPITVDELVNRYRGWQTHRPLWHLVQDVQWQTMVYMNIIDQAKLGRNAAEIKYWFGEELGLVPTNTLPNPTMSTLVDRAFKKVSKYKEILVDIANRYSRELLNELQFAQNLSANVQVDIGFPPSISLGVVELEVGVQVGN